MFIIKIISLLSHIIICAVPVLVIVHLLLTPFFSLLKKSLHVTIFDVVFSILAIMLLPVLFIKGAAIFSFLRERRFSFKIHALASFMIAAIFLIQMMRTFTDVASIEWHFSLILTFIISGIVLWKEIPDKILKALGGEAYQGNKL